MSPAPIISPSILASDFARLADEVADLPPTVPWVHVDVMDGHYVPNLTIGPGVVRRLRAATDRYLDTHLMVTAPDEYGPRFVEAGADSITFHPETVADPAGLVARLQEAGAQAGVAVRPGQPLSLVTDLLAGVDLLLLMTVEPGFGGQAFMSGVVPKIAEAAAWRTEHGASFRLEVDGGIAPDTVGATVEAGADTFVAGSAVFGRRDRAAAVADLREAIEGAGAGAGRRAGTAP